MAKQTDDWQDVAKGLQAKAVQPAPRLMRAFAKSTARVEFGLESQGHIPTIERMLAAGKPWRVIAEAIGWSEDAAMEHFIEYLLRQRSAAEQAARAAGVPVTERLPEDGVDVLWVWNCDNLRQPIDIARRRGDQVQNDNWHRDLELSAFTHWMPLPESPPSPVVGGPGAAERSRE